MSDNDQGVDDLLRQFGLPAKATNRVTIITLLEKQISLEEDEIGDQFLIRLLCAQLFSIGFVEDSILIWRAKSCNFDTCLGIDVQFLCGAGFEQTKNYLQLDGSDDAINALDYIAKCESDFLQFSVESVLQHTCQYYGIVYHDLT
jgi:hypothetical protein